MHTLLEIFLCTHDGGEAVRYHHTTHALTDPHRDPDAVLSDVLAALGLERHGLYAHSTSWRYEPGAMVVTYLVWCPPEHLARLPCQRLEWQGQELPPSQGPLQPRPAHIRPEHVLVHGLRHLRYLAFDLGEPHINQILDPTAKAALFRPMPPALAGRLEHQSTPRGLWGAMVACWTLLWVALVGSVALAERIAVHDFRGREVTLAQPAQRIVCLIESALSGLFMLGADSAVVGIPSNVYDGSVAPFYAAMDERIRRRTLPAPGNWEFVSLEGVLALQPDLVIIWADQRETIAALEEHGLPVYGVRIGSFADVLREIEDLGTLTGTSARAAELTAWAQTELRQLQATTDPIPLSSRPRVYFMWSHGELHTSGRPSTVHELITLAGGTNVAEGIEQEHTVVNMESVIAWAPEVIVMWANERLSPQEVMSQPLWRDLPAARQGRVYELPSVFFCDLWTLKWVHAARLVHAWLWQRPLDAARSKRELLLALYGPIRGARIPIEE